ncbi:hypothetical protein ScPMuIL_015153 [Solemya velum]
MSTGESKDKSSCESQFGVAHLKQEFVVTDYKPHLSVQYLPENVREELGLSVVGKKRSLEGEDKTVGEELPHKKIKLKGRNKRCRQHLVEHQKKLCPSIIHNHDCKYGNKCRFFHDVSAFFEAKPPDISPDCHNFLTFGKCGYGIACRFASKHISNDLKNIVNENVVKENEGKIFVLNSAPKDIIGKLWKKKYNFDRANAVLKKVLNLSSNSHSEIDSMALSTSDKVDEPIGNKKVDDCGNGDQVSISEPSVSKDTSPASQECPRLTNDDNSTVCASDFCRPQSQGDPISMSENNQRVAELEKNVVRPQHKSSSSGCLTDADVIRLRPQEKKLVGNLPFRRICKRLGADITCGEMAVATNILQGQMSEWALLKRHVTEDVFGVQLCGSYPDSMTRCAQVISETLEVDFVDINCGCPIDMVYKKGEGCALMGKMNKFEKIIRGMTSVLDVPLSVKMRTGIYSSKSVAHILSPKLRDWGVSFVTIHGRSREQRYTKFADWEYIDECTQAAAPLPIFGNGDIMSYEDADLHLEKTGVTGLMIARGALIKPWIFTEIKEKRHWDISANERFDILKEFVNNGLEHWGSDQQGLNTTRKFLLEWLSFLHRYIPVGLLERLPQKIHERPPHYKGRNDLETLMASANCADWIKISEMLLGPVPTEFTFLPKHKANAYK